GADRHTDVLTDVKQLHAASDSGELRHDVAEVHDHQQDHDNEGHPEAKLLADEVAEALACHDAHTSAHLLDDDERQRDGNHRPQQLVAILRAGLGVGEDATGVVIDVGGDEARYEELEEANQPGSTSAPEGDAVP